MMQSALRAVKTLSLLKPTSDFFSLAYRCMLRKFNQDAYARARAVENGHFLKIQIEQLKELRNRMTQQQEQDQNKNAATNEMKIQNEPKPTTKHRCVATNLAVRANPLPQQLRLLSDDEKIRKMEKKDMALWSKQIGELTRKRNLLALIGEYIELQEQYVVSKLRSNKKMLKNANEKKIKEPMKTNQQ